MECSGACKWMPSPSASRSEVLRQFKWLEWQFQTAPEGKVGCQRATFYVQSTLPTRLIRFIEVFTFRLEHVGIYKNSYPIFPTLCLFFYISSAYWCGHSWFLLCIGTQRHDSMATHCPVKDAPRTAQEKQIRQHTMSGCLGRPSLPREMQRQDSLVAGLFSQVIFSSNFLLDRSIFKKSYKRQNILNYNPF